MQVCLHKKHLFPDSIGSTPVLHLLNRPERITRAYIIETSKTTRHNRNGCGKNDNQKRTSYQNMLEYRPTLPVRKKLEIIKIRKIVFKNFGQVDDRLRELTQNKKEKRIENKRNSFWIFNKIVT
jgi:hypothetical protein